ncbi:MAG: segregation and condensation protein, partial [Actinomycetota bacterium]|nr:segregation and condensation protein [Actinomycetota bacterium]
MTTEHDHIGESGLGERVVGTADAEPAELVDGPGIADDAQHVPAGDADAPAGDAPADLRGAVEAILLVIDEPVRPKLLAQVLDTPEPQVEGCLRGLQAEYDDQQRGFELREVAGGWRLY